MRSFFTKALLISLPVLIPLLVYVVKDPFKVLYHYDTYFNKSGDYGAVGLNKDYISTRMFLQNNDKYHYDAYIFGNSRSMNYMIRDWASHIHDTACFHFDAGAESLYGIERKISFLHERKSPIRHALLVIDELVLKNAKNDEGHLYTKSPYISGETWLAFHMKFIKAYFDREFLEEYMYYIFTGRINPKNADNIADNKLYEPSDMRSYDIAHNEVYLTDVEHSMERNEDSVFNVYNQKNYFYDRGTVQKWTKPVISTKQLEMLRHIKEIFDEEHTDYRIVISPAFDQIKLDSNDLKQLCNTFGGNKVFDFSGINALTANVHNYYERMHYRPRVAKAIMDSIYIHEN